MNSLPIGIFDSGVGGLTVMREVRRLLPAEHLVYLGDTARVPYGNKSHATVSRYAVEDAQFLIGKGVKMIVVACNTASAFAASALRGTFPGMPILEMIGPGARAAVAATRNRRIGVIATVGTIGSGAYESRIREVFAASGTAGEVEILTQACPLFVPLVEEGELNSEITRLVALKYLTGLREAGIDTLVLGCTHYPLLRTVIADLMGPEVTLVDSAESAALETAVLLRDRGMLNESAQAPGAESFHVTDAAPRFNQIARTFLGHDTEQLELVELGSAG
ncbi:MAG: glutamate racemase [Verrucomicrobiales bacterium]|nr:glutamate racemase [Verrucomicrobiales bacterium]